MKRFVTLHNWFFAAGLWLAAIAIVGIIMRLGFAGILVLKLPFQHMLHAHSHIAFFGWMGSGLMGLFYFLLKSTDTNSFKKHETITFWLLQIFTLGAFVSFLAQGYALFSIIFSTLHVFLWYYFAWQMWPRFKRFPGNISFLFLKTALIFLLIASLGTWALPPIMVFHLDGTFLKRASIDFFIHTFSDGWLLNASLGAMLAISGVMAAQLSERSTKLLKANLWLMVPAVMLSSLRSVLPDLPAVLGVVALAAGIVLGILHLHIIWLFKNKVQTQIFRIVCAFLFLKALMEISTVLPGIAPFMQNRLVIIAYLHFKLLGVASLALCGVIGSFKRSIFKDQLRDNTFIAGAILMSVALGAMCLPLILPAHLLKTPEIMIYGQYLAILAGALIFISAVNILKSHYTEIFVVSANNRIFSQ